MAEKETKDAWELTKEEERMLRSEAEKDFAKLSIKEKLDAPGNLKMIAIAIILFDLISAVACLLLGDIRNAGMIIAMMLLFAWLGWFFLSNSIRDRIYFEKKLQYLGRKSKE